MCNKLTKTFQDFLKHGWFVPLIINIITCIFYGLFKIITVIVKKIPRKVWKEFFPHLKLKDKNLSLSKKIYIYISIVAQIWVILAIGFYILVPHLAKNKYLYDNITFYTYHKVNDSNVSDYFDKVQSMIINNPLYSQKMNIDIYLLNNSLIYTLLNPIELLPRRQTFAMTYQESIFINHANIRNNKAYASNKVSEHLDAILLHESVHVMQNSKYGWLYTSFKMPYWVKEGYPIYKSDEYSTYPMKKVLEFIKKDVNQIKNLTIFEKDKLYALMVQHAIEKMHKSVDNLHLGKVDYDEVLDSLLHEYNIIKEK